MVFKKPNKLAEELTGIAIRQLANSYQFKLPRINQIRKFRALYNNQVEKKLRIRYNVPVPIFSGMIDTLQADLDDVMILKYQEKDPADWKAVQKANAALIQESNSMRPGAMWSPKMRDARKEMLFSGRGFLKYVPSSDGGFSSNLYAPVFEDMYFEPKGGGQLENHLFVGQSDIWKTTKDLEDNAGGIYDFNQVKRLISFSEGNTYKTSSYWQNYDYSNRFLSLNLSAESNNYVGESMFNFVEWVLTYKGERWYLVFEAFSATWVRCEKLTDVDSSGYYPWMSFASHEDSKNFANKGFSDDLYPIAVLMNDMFNEDMENRKRRNSNSRAYDKDMFPDVAKLDEAQFGRDRLVPVDTKNGTRRIESGIYSFQTPEITGTIDTLRYIEDLTSRNLGVTDLQRGEKQGSDNKVGVTLLENQAISKRLSFESQPFIEVGQQLGLRFFSGLKDYMREPISIKLLGQDGYEWDELRRIDLNTKKDFEIIVTSQTSENKANQMAYNKKMTALATIRNSSVKNQNVNGKMVDEMILRDAGYNEIEIALLLDPKSQADKNTVAETSAAIQDIMQGRVPKKNYNATAYFLQTILDFVKTHQDDKKIANKMDVFMKYLEDHTQIAIDNETRRAKRDAMTMMINSKVAAAGQENTDQGQQMPGVMQNNNPMPAEQPGFNQPAMAT